MIDAVSAGDDIDIYNKIFFYYKLPDLPDLPDLYPDLPDVTTLPGLILNYLILTASKTFIDKGIVF